MIPLLWLTLACDPAPEPEEAAIELLSPRQQLIRLSVDLRGTHPTEAELAAMEANPDLYDEYVERYLQDPRFEDRIAEIFHLRFLTRNGETYFEVPEGVDEAALAASVGEEPLQLIRYIAANDLPWSTIVTAAHTMADPALAWWWDLERAEGDGWQPATWTDGRPAAGVLSMTTMWQKYPSAGVNSNRHRANQVSRILLCDDYLSRPVSFSRTQIDALTTGDPEDVIRDTPLCQSCHASLDPLAANFFGFWWEVEGDRADQTLYRPEDEELWRDHAGRSPAYYGEAIHGIPELAARLSADTRLYRCATRTVMEGLTQRSVEEDLDWEEIEAHRADFADAGYTLRALVRSVVRTETYRAAAIHDERAARIPTVKTVSPEQLATIIEGKTGYRWEFDGQEGLKSAATGLGVLAGGIDAIFVTVPNHEPAVGLAFVQERLAQAAAWHVATHDLDPARTEPAILLDYVTVLDTPDTAAAAFEAQVRDLYLRITGQPLADNATEPAALAALWKQLYSVDASPTAAWAGVVSVVLRDPTIILY